MAVVLVKNWKYNEVSTFIHMVAEATVGPLSYLMENNPLVTMACRLDNLISDAPKVPKRTLFNRRSVKEAIIARDNYINSNIGSIFALAKYPNLSFDFNECVFLGFNDKSKDVINKEEE